MWRSSAWICGSSRAGHRTDALPAPPAGEHLGRPSLFTGIVQAIGDVVALEPLGLGRRLTVAAPALGLDDVAVGDSIAVNGACMTVIARTATTFSILTLWRQLSP